MWTWIILYKTTLRKDVGKNCAIFLFDGDLAISLSNLRLQIVLFVNNWADMWCNSKLSYHDVCCAICRNFVDFPADVCPWKSATICYMKLQSKRRALFRNCALLVPHVRPNLEVLIFCEVACIGLGTINLSEGSNMSNNSASCTEPGSHIRRCKSLISSTKTGLDSIIALVSFKFVARSTRKPAMDKKSVCIHCIAAQDTQTGKPGKGQPPRLIFLSKFLSPFSCKWCS